MVLPLIDQKRGPCLDCKHHDSDVTYMPLYGAVYRGCVNLVGQAVARETSQSTVDAHIHLWDHMWALHQA